MPSDIFVTLFITIYNYFTGKLGELRKLYVSIHNMIYHVEFAKIIFNFDDTPNCILFRGGGPSQKGVGTVKRRQGIENIHMGRAGLRKAIKACFSGKKSFKIGFQFF